jgi:hypothetical protein
MSGNQHEGQNFQNTKSNSSSNIFQMSKEVEIEKWQNACKARRKAPGGDAASAEKLEKSFHIFFSFIYILSYRKKQAYRGA